MYRSAGNPRPHISTPDDITTINYTLEWPYLENPSNTTFAGPTQIDICRCPRPDLPKQHEQKPGHIYTRYQCCGPKVRFHSPEEELWVLQAPHGPINMLRPATREEIERRLEIHSQAEPAAYAGRNFLFLTGPCPRGRYQAYAALQFLKSLSPEMRKYIVCLSLLIQPYEEDCSDELSKQAYANLADYILHHLSSFRTLYLNIWDDEMRLRKAASEFHLLLHKEDAKIVLGCSWWRGEVKEYSNVKPFLEAMTTNISKNTRDTNDTRKRAFELGDVKDGVVWIEVKDEEEEDHEIDETDLGGEDHTQEGDNGVEAKEEYYSKGDDRTHSNSSSRRTSINVATNHQIVTADTTLAQDKRGNENLDHDEDPKEKVSGEREGLGVPSDGHAEGSRHKQRSESQMKGQTRRNPIQKRYSSDDDDNDWIDATMSPISPDKIEEGNWQVL
ncbi:hypothetical protein N0V83_008422 [Neocucurbitaria cava]|uniref:Uncharacterized protein n=1 Tax=Neocucurbitaria cava TaxID=798079 RepID=A0A9W8Y229_9PLEO|nr:hypothetical protein N0V83_008422 [Neocucurbitaria cava]